MRPVLFLIPILVLAGCATPPKRINNICAVFEQTDGFFTDWSKSAYKAERRWGVPRSVLLATIRVESGFDGKAKPPRKKILGFIPGKRPSSAFGYAQALDGTWDRYRKETGNWGAKRSDFDDAVDFVGWHHRLAHEKNGVALNDTYNLYLNYYLGHSGYRRGKYHGNAGLARTAQKATKMALSYNQQMHQCGR
ncbi:hypothetical protein B7H23_09455 [Notoacmeibacter marinus]|uniref:Transglycosylase SLT domain-containing protein n=1 Tax=Notoacmeibacter marinus TaxID=1876515 RepID=A0A231UWX8_9HYPH|nr:hypothetical protein [Notoacmeibacter marinus]OXT00357.1 hypothetical protein B7H23_09455 [Notoacmeibacter marinus]